MVWIACSCDWPFFHAVSAMECMEKKASAPMSDLKVPDTFCFIFSFRIPLSLALLSGGIAGFSRSWICNPCILRVPCEASRSCLLGGAGWLSAVRQAKFFCQWFHLTECFSHEWLVWTSFARFLCAESFQLSSVGIINKNSKACYCWIVTVSSYFC